MSSTYFTTFGIPWNSVPQNAKKGISRIVDFKIFLWEHTPDPPTMGWTYKSYQGPGTSLPIFHEVSATV